MQLNGSCHCGAIKFRLVSHTPQPYMRCYCSICRKTGGGGGYAINIMGEAKSLKVTGKKFLSVYRVKQGRKLSDAHRHFCSRCGSALWVADPHWPESVYPFASAIDTALPRPKETQHIMTDYAAPWVEIRKKKSDRSFAGYPKDTIIDWHKQRGLLAP